MSYTLAKGEVLNKDYLNALVANKIPVVMHTQPSPKVVQYDLTGYISLSQKLKQGVVTNKQAARYLLAIIDNLYTCKNSNISGEFLVLDLDFVLLRDEAVHFIIMPANKLPIEQTLNKLFQQFAMAWQPENATGTTFKGDLMSIAINETSEVLRQLVEFVDTMAEKVHLKKRTVKKEEIPEVKEVESYSTPDLAAIRKVKEEKSTAVTLEDMQQVSALTVTDETTLLTGIELPKQEIDTAMITKVRLMTTTGVEIVLKKAGEYVIGSSVRADIQLQESTVSRRHAVLRVEDTAVSIKDLGSSNGTFIANVRSKPEEYIDVTDCPQLRFAKIKVTLEVVY